MTYPVQIDLRDAPPTSAKFQAWIDASNQEVSEFKRKQDLAINLSISGFALGLVCVYFRSHVDQVVGDGYSWIVSFGLIVLALFSLGAFFMATVYNDRRRSIGSITTALIQACADVDPDTAIDVARILKNEPAALAYAKAVASQGRSLVMAEARAIAAWPAERQRHEAMRDLSPEALLSRQ